MWALGCILCYLCNGQHPFVDSAKLAIVNAKYKLPDEPAFQVFCPIISEFQNKLHHLNSYYLESLLQPDPYSRPTIRDVCDILEDIAASMGIRPTDPVIGLTSSSSESTQGNFNTDRSGPARFDNNSIEIIQKHKQLQYLRLNLQPVNLIILLFHHNQR